MTGIRRLAITLVCWLVLPHAARADFQWVSNWQLDSQQGTVQFFIPPSDPNPVSGPAAIRLSTYGDASNPAASSAITFHRDFRLVNMPTGQSASVNGSVDFNTYYIRPSTSGFAARVSGMVQIEDAAGVRLDGTTSQAGQFLTFPTTSMGVTWLTGGDSFSLSGLSNGFYTVSASFAVSAVPYFSTAGFINVPAAEEFITLSVPGQTILPALTQLPLEPEPSSAALFALGLLGLAGAGVRRLRRPF